MKRLLFLYCLIICSTIVAQEPPYDYVVFSNSRMSGDYFFSQVRYSGSSYVVNTRRRLPVSDSLFHTPGNALRLGYLNGLNGQWSAAVFKADIRGQDHFNPGRFLSFWIYSRQPIRTNELPVIQLMKQDSSLSRKVIFPSAYASGWQHVLIDVKQFDAYFLSDPTNILAVVYSQNLSDGKRQVLYVDDIEFISREQAPAISARPSIQYAEGYERHCDIQWTPVADTAIRFVKVYRSQNGGPFTPVGIQIPSIMRFTDFTGPGLASYQYRIAFLDRNYNESKLSQPVLVSKREMSDDDFLNMVEEACFRYYFEGSEKWSGLARENIPGRVNMIATGASGFGIMALIVGTERKFITRGQATRRFDQITSFLERAETFHGAFSHFIDGPSGRVEPFFGDHDNGGDLVETAFLVQGLLAARAYFDGDNSEEKAIRDRITKIWQRIEWSWYKQYPNSRYLYWHWSPDKAWIINHRLIGWNETMITYLLAIASPTHAVPASMYYTGWASQDTIAQEYRKAWSHSDAGARYRNDSVFFGVPLAVGVSNGGPLFFTHYSFMGYDPHQVNDRYTNYFNNNRHIAEINHLYCIANPKDYIGYSDSCWGLTASDGPYGYSADEPVTRQDRGKIAPTGAIGSFPYLPHEAMKALKNYYNNYGKFLWGEYGFRDAFNLTENWCSEIYMGLNQAPMAVMIENYRTGLIWKLFMSNPEIKEGLRKLEAASK